MTISTMRRIFLKSTFPQGWHEELLSFLGGIANKYPICKQVFKKHYGGNNCR